jgi:hypothetical protein
MEVSDFRLRKNTQEKQEKSSMMVKNIWNHHTIHLEKGSQTSVCINSNTSVDLDSTGFGTLCLDFDRAHKVTGKVR